MLFLYGRLTAYMLMHFHYIFSITMRVQDDGLPEIRNNRNMSFQVEGHHFREEPADEVVPEYSFVECVEQTFKVLACGYIMFHSLFFESIKIVTGPSLSNSTFI